MSLQVLVIEDYQPNRKAICGVIRSHSLCCHEVADMAMAKERLQVGGIDFCILDLRIPADDGDSGPRRENGRLLLQWMRKQSTLTKVPVIVVTGEDKGDTEFAASVVIAGGSEVTQYMTKPIAGDKLDQKIEWAMNLCGQTAPIVKKAFNEKMRELEIHEDRILFLGAEVWHETGQDTSSRDACAILSQQGKHGFVRMKGPALAKILKREVTNPIGTPINRLLDKCVEAAEEQGITCERANIMFSNKGGYHFTSDVRVSVVGDWALDLGVKPSSVQAPVIPAAAATPAPTIPTLSDRQQRIQDLKTDDPKLSNEQLAKKLKVSRATVVRDKNGMGRTN